MTTRTLSLLFLLGFTALVRPCMADSDFWHLNSSGGITWTFDGRAHSDHIEMSGQRMSCVLRYGVNAQGNFHCNFGMVWPMLRTLPNDTHASLQRQLGWDALEAVTVNKRSLSGEKVSSITLDGMMTVESNYGGLHLRRVLSPSTQLPAFVMVYTLKNNAGYNVTIGIDRLQKEMTTPATLGVKGSYRIGLALDKSGAWQLAPGDSLSFSAILYAVGGGEPMPQWNGTEEVAQRRKLVNQLMGSLQLTTPDPVINRMFAFAKIRACESIFQTKAGPMHSPGGEAYYAAIWANDQAEYADPFFPFMGYGYANESIHTTYGLFARYMNDAYKPLPSSVIAEGESCWSAAGDRGDAAMIAYGASRCALESGSKTEAQRLYPIIKWCLEYCRRKLTPEGVVASNSDELEGRFPSGEANLCTSSLYADALLSASYLARDLGDKAASLSYARQAKEMRTHIDSYFHATMDGFDTYRYYKGNDKLRAWICIPLTMGIYDRAKGTIDALFSPRLWTDNGLLTQEGDGTFWDRSTLYALRGTLAAGETERAMKFLSFYSHRRLLGDHVPYAIEAWPEGGQRHLSAESALYARIFTEGLFGIRPTGLHSISVTPRLPKDWQEMTLSDIHLCQKVFTLRVWRRGSSVRVSLQQQGKKAVEKTGKETYDFKLM